LYTRITHMKGKKIEEVVVSDHTPTVISVVAQVVDTLHAPTVVATTQIEEILPIVELPTEPLLLKSISEQEELSIHENKQDQQEMPLEASIEPSDEVFVEPVHPIHPLSEDIVNPNVVSLPVTPRPQYQAESTSLHIEVPKEIDARNIAQWHSRDDIVRDKFEKHIAKIRYDAGILKQKNDMLGYEKKLVEGLTLVPNDKILQRQLADLYFQQGKHKKAHSLLKKILIDSPEDHNALWQLGEITLEEWNKEDAYVYFSKACALCDDNPAYCLALAQRYYDEEQYDQI
jgi:tetratricopeptide (TPR) repeat protein